MIQAQLTIKDGAFSWARFAIGKYPSSDTFAHLMGILEGHPVTANIYSSTNICGHTTAEQLRSAFASIKDEYRFWIKEPQLNAVIDKFGDGKLGFCMGGLFCEQTPAEIESIILKSKLG